MNHLKPSAKPFPLPLVAAGMAVPEDEQLDYLVMPQGMATYQAPSLPEPEDLAGHEAALQALRAVRAQLQAHLAGQPAQAVALDALSEADRALVNQALGEGEVSARVLEAPGLSSAQIQESVFAGVWRVVEQLPDGRVSDRIEVGPVPQLLLQAAVLDALDPLPAVAAMPPGVMNAPAVLTELRDHRQRWRPGRAAAVVNLSLLPLTPEDARHIEERIGQGRVLILSRGYGNCRISNARVPHTWSVVYYNSQDAVILNSIEVTDLPDVACAAREDLEDSLERLAEVLAWMEQA
jgi:hydrogenase-1 operon protein HyaF